MAGPDKFRENHGGTSFLWVGLGVVCAVLVAAVVFAMVQPWEIESPTIPTWERMEQQSEPYVAPRNFKARRTWEQDIRERCFNDDDYHEAFAFEVLDYLPHPDSMQYYNTVIEPGNNDRYYLIKMYFAHSYAGKTFQQVAAGSLDSRTCEAIFMFIE